MKSRHPRNAGSSGLLKGLLQRTSGWDGAGRAMGSGVRRNAGSCGRPVAGSAGWVLIEVAGDRPCESFQRCSVEFVLPAEAVDHFRPGVPGLGVPEVMGQLEVSDHAAVFVAPLDDL